ncbi:MAG TPA: ATP-binding protein [Cyclobacteriaceae bacterium]|nr:ATP-binding protein [Cyclobacteriaceae bacterium]HRJ81368.1 ATP-binding protein [Cyclobacteriaceae bacterium]
MMTMKPKKMTMRHSEGVEVDKEKLKALYALVARGEGEQLEFKRKATHPEKIVREMIAFANSKGGTVLIGVSDDGSIPGVKFPDEELFVVQRAITRLSRPHINYEKEIISLSTGRYVISLKVLFGKRKPYFLRLSRWRRGCFIRIDDKSIKASKEVQQILYLQAKQHDVQFTYGEYEQKLFRHLDKFNYVTVAEFSALCDIGYHHASNILVQLVLANVLKIEPHEKGDQYAICRGSLLTI